MFFSLFLFQQWYVLYPLEGPWYELLVIPLRFELLCSIMIPISIKVSQWYGFWHYIPLYNSTCFSFIFSFKNNHSKNIEW
jgi:hypothetical protein